MPAKKSSTEENDPHTIPTPTEDGDSADSIRIADSVVASIVKMACLEVDGVYSVGGSGDGFWENMTGKKPGRGVVVELDEAENYVIEVHLEMRFGVELAKTAMHVQQNVRDHVSRMTMKAVAQVEVIIDGVRLESEKTPDEGAESWEHPHTD